MRAPGRATPPPARAHRRWCRCSSLLTVEQLAIWPTRSCGRQQGATRSARIAAAPSHEDPPLDPEPEGSVRLGLDLPVDVALSLPSFRPGNVNHDRSKRLQVSFRRRPPRRGPPPGDSSLLPAEPLALLSGWTAWSRPWAAGCATSPMPSTWNCCARVNRSLLPVSLLDAVLSGQLDTLAAPANLLRLQLPFWSQRQPAGDRGRTAADRGAGTGGAAAAHLPARLQRHRQEVRRMAQQFRRLQRRLRITRPNSCGSRTSPGTPWPRAGRRRRLVHPPAGLPLEAERGLAIYRAPGHLQWLRDP